MPRRRIRRNRRGEFELHLPANEREVLRSLPGQLMAVLGSDDRDLRRLFPPAYTEDREAEEEYRHLMGSELEDSHRRALETMAATVDSERLDADQMGAWLQALNELRLFLGTRLDVQEDQEPPAPGDPRAPMMALYGYLSWLQDQAVEALSGTL